MFEPKASEGAKVQSLKQPGHGQEMVKVSIWGVSGDRRQWDSRRDQVRKACAVCGSQAK